MEHTDASLPISPEEKKFNECMTNGDNYFKIEIYRLAKEWYNRALETGINKNVVETKLQELNKKIASERKTIFILLGIAAVIILSAIIFTAF